MQEAFSKIKIDTTILK